MKFNVMIGNKRLVEPDFKVYTHVSDNDLVMIGLRNMSSDEENKISGLINKNKYKIEISHGIIGLTIDDIIYSFDIGEFLGKYIECVDKDYFYLVFSFLDENDKIKTARALAIKMDKKAS
jgi:hypothetical protein